MKPLQSSGLIDLDVRDVLDGHSSHRALAIENR